MQSKILVIISPKWAPDSGVRAEKLETSQRKVLRCPAISAGHLSDLLARDGLSDLNSVGGLLIHVTEHILGELEGFAKLVPAHKVTLLYNESISPERAGGLAAARTYTIPEGRALTAISNISWIYLRWGSIDWKAVKCIDRLWILQPPPEPLETRVVAISLR